MKLSKFGRLFETAIFNILPTGKQSATFQCGWGPCLYLGGAGGGWPAGAPGPGPCGLHRTPGLRGQSCPPILLLPRASLVMAKSSEN